MNKILFLDVDGVLNSRQYILSCPDFDDPAKQMDPAAVARLNRITDATNCSIVISSTWRMAFLHSPDAVSKIRNCMASYGITGHILDMTPDLLGQGNHRGDEIQMWLAMQDKVDVFAILDDQSVTGMDDHLIKTTFDDGLQDTHVDQVIAKLGRK